MRNDNSLSTESHLHLSSGAGLLAAEAPIELPSGWSAAMLPGQPTGSALGVALVLSPRKQGPLLLDGDPCSSAWLGALIDRRGLVREWLELRVQAAAARASWQIPGVSLGNQSQDDAWEARVQATSALDPGSLLLTGWESQPPPPTLLDLEAGRFRIPTTGAGGHELRLCRDEELLQRKGLPPYRHSFDRLLYAPSLGDASPFVDVSSAGGAIEGTTDLATIDPATQSCQPFNVAAGLLLIRRFEPVGLEAFSSLLDGAGWPDRPVKLDGLPIEARLRQLADRISRPEDPTPLFLSRAGRGARQLEVLHLKLCLLHDAWTWVQRTTSTTRRPLLNLDADSFRVRLSDVASRLPLLWTARVVLTRPGASFEARLPLIDDPICLQPDRISASPYWPAPGPPPVPRPCEVQIAAVERSPGGGAERIVVRAVVRTREGFVGLLPSDLVALHMVGRSRMIELVGQVQGDWASSSADFVSRRLDAPADLRAELEAMVNVPQPRARLLRIPSGSSEQDLYALEVLAARLLVSSGQTLVDATRAINDLVAVLRRAPATGEDLADPIGTALADDARLRLALGPQRLMSFAASRGDAGLLESAQRDADRDGGPSDPDAPGTGIPERLWHEVLAFLVAARLEPQRNGGPSADPTLFDPGLAHLERLTTWTRTLVAADWDRNREIRQVIAALRAQLA